MGAYLLPALNEDPFLHWTGPAACELNADGSLKAQVPEERWPFGPPYYHENCCILRIGGLYCDCKASDASEPGWGKLI